jgi:hypothetical protein
VLATACAALHTEPVAGAPPGTSVYKIAGRPAAHPPTDPALATVSEDELRSSLRRIHVRYARFTRFVTSDPLPLLSDTQATQYAAILAKELPGLAPTERLRFTFQDRYFGRGYSVDMEAYRDGNAMVYGFYALAVADTQGNSGAWADTSLGQLVAVVPGQEIVKSGAPIALVDPLLGAERELAANLEAKKRLLEQARTEALFDPDEAPALESLLTQPKPSPAAWKLYWDKRRTLKKAVDQELIDRITYRAQVERLTRDLEN